MTMLMALETGIYANEFTGMGFGATKTVEA